MKKIFALITISIIILLLNTFYINKIYAVQNNEVNNEVNNETSKLIELKEKELNSLRDYEETYGSKSYGLTGFILHKVQVYSIPFCFLGILAGAIYDYVLGIRHLETKEKGLALMVTFITLGVICQVLPLAFTIVVKFGRE